MNRRALSETNLFLSSKRYSSATQLSMLSSSKSLERLDTPQISEEEAFSIELQRFYERKVRTGREKALENKLLAFTAAMKVLINAQLVNERFTITELVQRNPRYCEIRELEANCFEFEIPVYLDGNYELLVHYAEEGGFVRLQIEDCSNWDDCVTEEGYLSASLVRSNLQLTLQKTLINMSKNIENEEDNLPDGVESISVFCDGSTIVLDINHGGILVDLVPSIRLTKYHIGWCKKFTRHIVPTHVLAKACERPMSDPESLWLLSFVEAEKKMLRQLKDNQQRLLDILVELREMDELLGEISFAQMQTVLFHLVSKIEDGFEWRDEELGERFLDALCILEEFLEKKYCEHFYISEANLFVAMGTVTMSQLKDKIRRITKPSCVACGLASIFGATSVVKCGFKGACA
ncbi:predicted protein [Nematostella vectensis]|uniref:Mab-21-like nucleotidyltransferase domain-containing protein n=1 Tax=Nematostella vectensis TaxID=45351 RepID=A7SLQ4_NEMVE|nr:predicted protein [Nematostella vectensis]|eukprot:XP_001627438.1 predicted protein [Nematostella vectensis]